MNKSQKILNDLMLKILPFEEFRQNDVVGYNRSKGIYEKCQIIDIGKNYISLNNYNEWYHIKGVNDKTINFATYSIDLKFISRDWKLPDLLMAMMKRHPNPPFTNYHLEPNGSFAERQKDGTWLILFDYDLTKSVLDQESIKEIIGVLK